MGLYRFKLPDLGEGIVESEISEWHVNVGDAVEEDQHIADVMTDKAIVEVTAPVSGTVLSLACEAGEILAVGQELIRFEVAGEGNLPATGEEAIAAKSPTAKPETIPEPVREEPQPTHNEPQPLQEEPQPTHKEPQPIHKRPQPEQKLQPELTAPPTSTTDSEPPQVALPNRTILTSPSLRRRAREANIDLSLVPGSGPHGRITERDMDAFIAATEKRSAAGNPGYHQSQNQGQRQATTEVKIKGLRRIIARKMQQAKRQIPHYSYIEEVDVTHLEELRQHLNTNRGSDQPKLTLLPFILQALTKVLPQFPHCNAHYDDENNLLTQYQAVHTGIATMTESGLMVPVIKHCESLDLWQGATEIARVSEAARIGSAGKDELSGSTITITSLGAIGGIATTPIINAPETTIIGVNKLQERPMIKDGGLATRKMMNLSSSFDHRIVDGLDGARLVQALKALLENPGALFT